MLIIIAWDSPIHFFVGKERTAKKIAKWSHYANRRAKLKTQLQAQFKVDTEDIWDPVNPNESETVSINTNQEPQSKFENISLKELNKEHYWPGDRVQILHFHDEDIRPVRDEESASGYRIKSKEEARLSAQRGEQGVVVDFPNSEGKIVVALETNSDESLSSSDDSSDDSGGEGIGGFSPKLKRFTFKVRISNVKVRRLAGKPSARLSRPLAPWEVVGLVSELDLQVMETLPDINWNQVSNCSLRVNICVYIYLFI